MIRFAGAGSMLPRALMFIVPYGVCRGHHGLAPAVWDVIYWIAATSRTGWSRTDVTVATAGTCPTRCWAAVLRSVDELVTNAIEHAFSGQKPGRVTVTIDSRPITGVLVTVSDTGCGFRHDGIVEGNGLRLLRLLGDVSVTCGPNRCTVQCRIRPGGRYISDTNARRAEVLA